MFPQCPQNVHLSVFLGFCLSHQHLQHWKLGQIWNIFEIFWLNLGQIWDFRKQIRFSIIIVWLFENWVDRNVILLKVETFLKTNKNQHHHNVSVWKLDWPKLSRFLQSICLYVCLGFCLFKSPTSRTLVELNCVTEGQPRLPPKYQVRQSHEQKVENSSHNHSLVRLYPFLKP